PARRSGGLRETDGRSERDPPVAPETARTGGSRRSRSNGIDAPQRPPSANARTRWAEPATGGSRPGEHSADPAAPGRPTSGRAHSWHGLPAREPSDTPRPPAPPAR